MCCRTIFLLKTNLLTHLVIVMRSVDGQTGGDGFPENDGSLLPLLHDDVGGRLAHHVHHVERALHLIGQYACAKHGLRLHL